MQAAGRVRQGWAAHGSHGDPGCRRALRGFQGSRRPDQVRRPRCGAGRPAERQVYRARGLLCTDGQTSCRTADPGLCPQRGGLRGACPPAVSRRLRGVADAEDADAVLVNTCGFIEAAKRESVDTLLSVGGSTSDGRHRSVVAVGCMAERYGTGWLPNSPEADAVLGFDHYPNIADRLREIVEGGSVPSHVPRDRRTLLPMAPTDRPGPGCTSRATAGLPALPPKPPRTLRWDRRGSGGASPADPWPP